MITDKLNILKSFDAITLTRKLPANLNEVDRHLFIRTLQTTIQSIKVFRIDNATITSHGAIIKNLTFLSQITLYNDQGEIVPYGMRDILEITFFWPRRSLSKINNYLVIHNVFSETYYHWLLEALPRLFLIREQISTATLLLPANHNKNFHKESLKIFGVERVEILDERVKYVAPVVFTSTQIGRIANYHPEILMDMVHYIKSRIRVSSSLSEKIYVSRSKAWRRKVVNEQEIEAYLSTMGFMSVSFEDYSFEEQVSIMHHCRYLISIHGAGLANMIFMEPNGRVMELRKYDRGENYFFFSLASSFNHDYYYQFCDPAGEQNIGVQDADIFVDLKKFTTNVHSMLS